MPPQHGKSELTSRRLPAYILGKDPTLKIAGCSYSSDVATSFNRDVQRIIDSDKYQKIFPNTTLSGKNIKTSARGSYLRNADIFEVVGSKGAYKSVGVGGSLTSFTADVLIIDDPVKDAVEASSATDQQRKWDWYTSVALTRGHNDARQLITMTRWHKHDLCGKILNKMPKGWVVLHLEAIKQKVNHEKDPRKFGEALWPSRHSKKRIMEFAEADPRTFDALFQGDPSVNKTMLYATGFHYGKSVSGILDKKPLPLHYTVDFNSSPYMSGLVIQLDFIKNGFWNGHDSYFELRVIQEFTLKPPINDAFSLAKSFEEEHPEIKNGFFLYGDASGNNNTGIRSRTDVSKTQTLFGDLISGFSQEARNGCTQRIPKRNPRYASIGQGMLGRRVFLNKIISGILPVRFLVNPDCSEFIEDLKECKQDPNGKLAKPKNKQGEEERGHLLQAFEYFICHEESLGYLARTK